MNAPRVKPKRWAAPASLISKRTLPLYPADGASGSLLRKLWRRRRIFCCWTSRRTTWISQASNGWRSLLQSARFAAVVISHDRYFLENVPTEVAELNRIYAGGLLRVAGNYSAFLVRKGEFLQAQMKQQESLANRVRTEIEWLRRGPKARATKAKARINKAHEMIADLADLKGPQPNGRCRHRFQRHRAENQAADRARRSELFDSQTGRCFRNSISSSRRACASGWWVPNGSGKTTLLRLLRGELVPEAGEVRRAEQLRVVYFDQNRELDPDVALRRALAPDGDSVIYHDRMVHVASWAARFLFTGEQLNQPVGRLSGGEKARVLIAKLMLEPADVLLLDEPTNDLDIPTLEILEDSLLEFRGALVLVTHDRYLLDRVSTVVLGLDGQGGAGQFADYSPVGTLAGRTQSAERKALNCDKYRRRACAASEEKAFVSRSARIRHAGTTDRRSGAGCEGEAIDSGNAISAGRRSGCCRVPSRNSRMRNPP